MSDVAQLISEIQADGLHLTLTDHGTIRAKGNRERLAYWVPILRQRKPDILRALSRPAVIPGGAHTTPRPRVSRFRVTVEGSLPFPYIVPGGCTLAEAGQALRRKFGDDRFIAVEPLRGRS